jgi:hypothetical protein
VADPAGDYAVEAFRRAEAIRPGSRAALEAKAPRLAGGPGHRLVPGPEREPLGRLRRDGGGDELAADVDRDLGGAGAALDRADLSLELVAGAEFHVRTSIGG